jgi:hypothetical protein
VIEVQNTNSAFVTMKSISRSIDVTQPALDFGTVVVIRVVINIIIRVVGVIINEIAVIIIVQIVR